MFSTGSGSCQQGSNVVADKTFHLRNLLWISNHPDSIYILDARPKKKVHQQLIDKPFKPFLTVNEVSAVHVIFSCADLVNQQLKFGLVIGDIYYLPGKPLGWRWYDPYLIPQIPHMGPLWNPNTPEDFDAKDYFKY